MKIYDIGQEVDRGVCVSQSDLLAHAYKPSAQEAKARGSKLKDRLEYTVRSCFKAISL